MGDTTLQPIDTNGTLVRYGKIITYLAFLFAYIFALVLFIAAMAVAWPKVN